MLEYSRALKSDPDNLELPEALERARLRAAEAHAAAGAPPHARGHVQGGARRVPPRPRPQPGRGVAGRGHARGRGAAPARRAARARSPRSRSARARRSLPGLQLGPGAPASRSGLSFRGTSLREAYQALGRVAGVNFVFDPQFQDHDDQPRPPRRALRAGADRARPGRPDVPPRGRLARGHGGARTRPTKRREYEQQVVKTFFLSNADLKETIDLLRIVLGARRVAPLPGATRSPSTTRPTRSRPPSASSSCRQAARRGGGGRGDPGGEPHAASRSTASRSPRAIPGVEGVVGGHLPEDDPETSRRAGQPTTARADNPYRSVQPRRHQPARRDLPAAADRRATRACWPTRSCARPRARPRRRASATRSRCRSPSSRPIAHRRRPPAAGHVVRVQERRRQHRHHAARPPRRRRHAWG